MVQNLVAEAISVSTKNFFEAHEWSKAPFRLKLSVHDSIVLTCKGQDVPYICETLIPRCMATDNIIPKLNFTFGLEMSLHTRLATKASHEELEEAGVPEGYWPQDFEAAQTSTAFENPYPTSQVAA